MEIVEGTIEAEYVQTIWLSEGITEAKNNTPVVLKCRIFGDVVGESFAGQKKRIIGQFKSVPRKGQRFNDVLIDAISISSLDDTDVQLPTDDELQEWKERVKDPEKFFDEIIEESYGGIGNIGPKKSCFLSTISAPKTEKRINNVHVLLLGDPGTYKSTLMEETQSFTYKSIFTGGKGNTAAGLTGGMDRPAPNMPLVFLPGALTLANNGTAYIDEIDKMRDHDRESVLIGMAKGYIPINKVGIHGILPANTTIIAAANPKGGRWKPDVPVLDQTNLSEPLLSRFDIVWLIMDEVNEYRDTQISNYSVNQMNQSEEKIIDSKKIMRYINYVKTLNPELTSEAKKSITQYYVKLRMLSKEQNTLPIDPRKIEGLAKLAMARARLLMKKKTDEDDVKVATDLFEDSLRSFGIDISTGKIQETFKGSRELNKEETVWECINEIKDDRDCFTESEFIDALANTKYFDDESARKELYKWNQKLGRINLNNDGTYRT